MQPAGAEAGEIQSCLNLHYTVLYRYYVEFLIYNVLCCNLVVFFPPSLPIGLLLFSLSTSSFDGSRFQEAVHLVVEETQI